MTTLPLFPPGFRLIDGSDLNALVNEINALAGGGGTLPVSGTTGNFSTSVNSPIVNAGSSGNVGVVNIFPATGAKGHVALTSSDAAGNTTTTVNVAAQAAARTLTIPDPGGNATFLMSAGNQTASGTLGLGAQGTLAGELDLASPTAAKGFLTVKAADSVGNTTTLVTNASMAAARTLTIPDPAGNGTFAMTSGSNLNITDILRCSGNATQNGNITYLAVPGLGPTPLAVGTYDFDIRLAVSTGATPGIKTSLGFTGGLVLSSMQATGVGMAAAAIVTQTTTVATTGADLFSAAQAALGVWVYGTLVVSTAGSVTVQMAQSVSNASNTIVLVGSSARFTRIA